MWPFESATNDAFHDQMVGGASCSYADSKVEFPLRAEIDVDGREELLLLIAERIESA